MDQITLQNNVIDFVYADKHRFTYSQFTFSNEFHARSAKKQQLQLQKQATAKAEAKTPQL